MLRTWITNLIQSEELSKCQTYYILILSQVILQTKLIKALLRMIIMNG